MSKESFSKELTKEVIDQGYGACRNFLSSSQIEKINRELDPWLQQIMWNDTYGYSIVNRDKWLFHLGICSKAVVNVILNETLLDFMASIFGCEPIVSELSLHLSVTDNPELAYHSDRAGGVILYIFLTEMNKDNGQLCCIPKTQHNNEFFYIPEKEWGAKLDQEIGLIAAPGDALLFDQDIWHRRKAGIAGRKVIKVLYHPEDRVDGAVDHLYRQSVLSGLTPRQLKCFGVGQPPFEREGHLRKLGRRFYKEDISPFLQYMRRLRRLSWKPSVAKPSLSSKLAETKPRKRAVVEE